MRNNAQSIALLLVLSLSYAAHFEGTVELSEKFRWAKIVSFAMDIGSGLLKGRVSPQFNHNADISTAGVEVHLFLDEEWADVSPDLPCSNFTDLARSSFSIPREGKEFEHEIRQSLRAHNWFFVLSLPCKISPPEDKPIPVHYNLTLLNADSGHLPYDLTGMKWVHLAVVGLVVVGMACSAPWIVKHHSRFGRLHPVVIGLITAALLLFAGQLMHWGFVEILSTTGRENRWLDLLGDSLNGMSRVVISSMLIVMVWDLTSSGPMAKKGVIVLCLLQCSLLMARLLFAPPSHYQSADKHVWIVDMLLIYLAFPQMIMFLMGGNACMKDIVSPNAQAFMKTFIVYGVLYWLSAPCLFGISLLWADYLQHKFLYISTVLVNLAALSLLFRLFLGRSEYEKIASMGLAVLPGFESRMRGYKL